MYLSTQVVLLEKGFFGGSMTEPFILFGEQHTQALTYSFVIILILCVLGNFLSNKMQEFAAKLIGVSSFSF